MRMTCGEQLLGRRLMMENRAGIPHYVTGQLEAEVERVEDEDGVTYAGSVGFVNEMGRAVCVAAIFDDEENRWVGLMYLTAGHMTADGAWRQVGDDFTLTRTMIEKLNAAKEAAR
jgi:hypothetical protein